MPNDGPGDPDVGPNFAQNYPVLLTVVSNSPVATRFKDGDIAVFTDTATNKTVIITAGGVRPSSWIVNNSNPATSYTFSNSA